MPHARRFRTSVARALAVGAVAVAGGGLLVGCGSDDSTATSTPTATTTAAATTEDAEESGEPTTSAPVTNPGEAATAPPSEPEPVPDDYPGPAEVPVSEDGKRFLDALRAAGITPAGDGSIAVSTADYICQAQREGLTDADTMIFVTAMVGTEASASGTELGPDQAAAQARTYVDVAHADYCR
ncbi:DUF732 domain-containing protein [Rhodococcus triatomae]|uniref:Uncharacterized protein n=1 Tax=Rhodococcus triatomae TaxID=300028 RepID=A0A1G8HZ30_9NOCA|nr:DUF732 domain-containing protein [Rhodococcus triatomae]QNG20915.1 DUF732 domain-containing protein [Rhodococcus triatomae]QNG23170.1 DUF732 domain-containing protein [Rhodococcus triatomae]SDI11939.1 hypothetical protein SAMN05444695_105110 [Rhodococcus triatomae]